jgi:outer membrane receptor for monomeric catechols
MRAHLSHHQFRNQSETRKNTYGVDKSANQKFTALLIDTPQSKSITIVTDELTEDSDSLTLQDALRTVSSITL